MFSKFTKFAKFSTNFDNQKIKQWKGLKEVASSRTLGLALAGLGAGGLAYLMWNAESKNAQMTKSMIAGGSLVSRDISLQRTKSTLTYFAGSVAMTSAMVFGMLRSQTILRYSLGWTPLLVGLPLSIFSMYKLRTTPASPDNTVSKHLFWGLFNSCIAFSLVPIISMSHALVIRDAFLVTSGAFGGLGLVAMNARDDAFLGMSGFLGAGLGCIGAIGIANIFLQSNALFNVWLYGGLALFLAYVLYDMKQIQNKAKRSAYFDPMSESVGVYLDFVNIFIRILMIMNNRNNNRK
jgi:FtsH-binding integral membrane protein